MAAAECIAALPRALSLGPGMACASRGFYNAVFTAEFLFFSLHITVPACQEQQGPFSFLLLVAVCVSGNIPVADSDLLLSHGVA